jgi:hypothetical protein
LECLAVEVLFRRNTSYGQNREIKYNTYPQSALFDVAIPLNPVEAFMNKSALAIVAAIVLVVGGFITLSIIASGPNGPLPVRVQTLNPAGSALEATPDQALAFLILGVIAAGSLIGGGVVLSLIFRFLDREITKNRLSQ